MRNRLGPSWLAAGVLVVAAALLAGCRQYEIDVVLHADGSGSRALMLQPDLEEGAEQELTQGEFSELFCLDQGWTGAREREPSGSQEELTFRRREEFRGLADWAAASGDLRIRGATGPERFGDVEFTNQLTVEVAGEAGARTLTYEESFAWTGLREIIVAHEAEAFCDRLMAGYPWLTAEDRLELTGLLAGSLLTTVRLDNVGDDAPATRAIVTAVAAYTCDVIRRRQPDAACEGVAEVAADAVHARNTDVETFLQQMLPGAYLAAQTSITLRVTMPGRIADSNADRVEGRTASWTFQPWDALVEPSRLFARFELSE